MEGLGHKVRVRTLPSFDKMYNQACRKQVHAAYLVERPAEMRYDREPTLSTAELACRDSDQNGSLPLTNGH